MSEEEIYQYPGKRVDVSWDGRLCIHVSECGRAKGELFVTGRKPWCQPDLVSDEEVVDVVMRCPAGALTYTMKDSLSGEAADAQNAVVISYNGPLYVKGDLEIEGATEDMPSVGYRAALCRCGKSKRKPFCDNSHEQDGFRDYGAVGVKGEGLDTHGGTLVIKRARNGPLLLSGNFTIIAASGREAWHGTRVALCRCGHSKNKPFCDGRHLEAGFTAD